MIKSVRGTLHFTTDNDLEFSVSIPQRNLNASLAEVGDEVAKRITLALSKFQGDSADKIKELEAKIERLQKQPTKSSAPQKKAKRKPVLREGLLNN